MQEEMKRARSLLVKAVVKELLYQGYVAGRLTGLTPGDVKKAIRSANRSRLFIAVPFAIVLLIIVVEGYFLFRRSPLLFPLSVLTWTFMPTFVTVIQLSYGASSGPQIREFLVTLPLEEDRIYGVAAGAVVSSLAASIIAPVIILLLSIPLVGIWVAVSGLIADAMSVSFALIVVSLIINIYRRLGSTNRLSAIIRIAITVPILLLSLSFGYFQTADIRLSSFEETYLPVLNLAGVALGNVEAFAIASTYALVIVLLGYYGFRRTSVSLLSPLSFFSSKLGRFRVRVRSPSTAMIMSDFRQITRSPRLAGFIAVPFLYVIVTIFQGFSFHSSDVQGSLAGQIQFVTNVLPVVAISSFLAYVLYLTELRGYAYLETLPLAKFTNLKSKLTVVLIFYMASALIMGITYLYLGSGVVILPMLGMSLAVASSVIYTAIYFRYSVRTMLAGVVGILNQAVYTVINLFIFGIPAAVYTVGLFLTRSFIAPLPYLVAAGLLELIFLLWMLAKAK
ncbi:MAG: hypothetical protein QXX17_03400 [Conexivisphaerales archaeon]